MHKARSNYSSKVGSLPAGKIGFSWIRAPVMDKETIVLCAVPTRTK